MKAINRALPNVVALLIAEFVGDAELARLACTATGRPVAVATYASHASTVAVGKK